MSIDLLHPIANYIFWTFLLIGSFGWLLELKFIKFRNKQILVGLCYFILFIGYLIFTSFAFVFFAFTGVVANFLFYWCLGLLAIFGWWLFGYVDTFSEIYNTSFKKMMIIFLGIFVLLFLFFYIFFYEDRIYKVSKHCKPTENPKIKICKFSNGVYTGELKAFLRHGEGVYNFNSGASYSGGWKNSLRHGVGTMITAEGVTTTDTWNKGKKSN